MNWMPFSRDMDEGEFIASLMMRGFERVHGPGIVVNSFVRHSTGDVSINVLPLDNHVSIYIRMPMELTFDHDSSPATKRKALKQIDHLLRKYDEITSTD